VRLDLAAAGDAALAVDEEIVADNLVRDAIRREGLELPSTKGQL